jgi:DNA-binding LytR/AlgR family response regulator
MRKLRIFILEDEVVTQEVLRAALEDFGYEVCGMADNAEQALYDIQQTRPELVMLDIMVNADKNGIWFARQLEIPFIFLTAFSDRRTMNKALITRPYSYLINPFENAQIYAAVEIALQETNSVIRTSAEDANESQDLLKVNKEILLRDGKIFYNINLEEIVYAKLEGKHLELRLEDKRIVLRYSLVRFMKEFAADNLLQVHRSYVVNMRRIETVLTEEIKLGPYTIPVSRNYRQELMAII